MSAITAAGYVVAALGALVGVIILVTAGWIIMRSGVVRGLRDAAEGWEKRADLLAANLSDAHDSAIAAAALATENAASIAEQHRVELGELRDALSIARERIAVLEAKTDLEPIRDWMLAHEGDALSRHEAIVNALERIAPEAAA